MTRVVDVADGVRWAVHGDLDEDDARVPIVFLHGFTESARSWESVMARLRERHRVIAIDVVGHGASDAPDDPSAYTFEAVDAALATIARELALPPAVWVGYSMGGRVTLHFALNHPDLVRALVLESATPGLADDRERALRRESDAMLAASILKEGVPAFVDRWLAHPVFAPERRLGDAHLATVRADKLDRSAVGLARALEGLGQAEQPDLRPRLPGLSAPTLLVAGTLDDKYADHAGDMARRFPDARVVLVAGCGHAPHRERAGAFVAAVEGFLAAHAASHVQSEGESSCKTRTVKPVKT